ncbi:hypothetical protein VP01_4949g1 [Puccinia sorghi]|uniref:Uncharacterized protein n=1 Tax=Puccinia sorghi TaxID=27349 RepID=A0A0L6UMQ8_9BASI|nr:hypothetical protein VP01_4949g1 [Puccinia sorghi]
MRPNQPPDSRKERIKKERIDKCGTPPSVLHTIVQKWSHCQAAMKFFVESSSDEPEIIGRSQKRQKNTVKFGSTSKSMPTASDPTTSCASYLPRSERRSYSNHKFPVNTSSSPMHLPAAPSYIKGRYVNSGKAQKSLEGITPSSVRKYRSDMNARQKDEDENLSNAIHHHIRILTSTGRNKDDRLPLATEENLKNIQQLQTRFNDLSIPANAPYLLTQDQVNLNIADDANVQIGFVRLCEQKARLYGLPFVGLALEDHLKGPITYGKYPEYNLGADDSQYLESARKNDRKAGRRSRLQKHCLAACQTDPGLSDYAKLSLDDKLCSLHESMEDPMDKDKIFNYPKRGGRKPAKRLPPGDKPVISDQRIWPTGFPEDCYAQPWLQKLDPQEKIALQTQEPMLGGLIDVTH